MFQTHEVKLPDGSVKVLWTPRERVLTVFDAPDTPLGPLHVPVSVDRAPELSPYVPPAVLSDPAYARQWEGSREAIRDAAARTFEAARFRMTPLAPPALALTRQAASDAAERILHAVPPPYHHAARIIVRAHMGDHHSRSFLHKLVRDAKAGIRTARHAANGMLEATKFVAHAVDLPVLVAGHIKGVGGVVRAISPFEHFGHMVSAVQHGDFKALEKMMKQDLSMIQGVISLVPGIGTGLSSAISAGLAALESGRPIEIALKLAYGAIPIPIGIRQVTDTVLDTVLTLLRHPHNFTDVVLQVAREKIPNGLPRHVFDSLVHVLVKHVPLKKELVSVATETARKYVGNLAGPALQNVAKSIGVHTDALEHLAANVAKIGGPGARALLPALVQHA